MMKRGFAAGFLALLLSVVSYGEFVNQTLVQNSDGTYDTEYPNGDKPPGSATLAWDLTTLDSAMAIPLSTAYSDDLNDCCLSGTSEAAATITIEDCSGDVAADNGWNISGADPDQTLGNLGTDADLPGSGAFRLRATDGAESAVSLCINWSYITAPAGDTQAPPIPTGMEVTDTAVNEVTIEFDPTCDNHDGAEAASGTVQYNIEISGTPTTTVTQGACSTPLLTETVVGTTDSETSSINGNGWDMTFAGGGISDATDHVLLRGTTLAGDVSVIAKVTSLSSAASFPKAGVYIRESTAVGASGYFMYYQGNGNFQMRGRSAPDVVPTSPCTQTSGTLPVWVKLTRDLSANTITSYYSNDGGTWTLCATTALSMPSSVQVGVFVTSESAGTTATANLDQVNLHALPRVSKAVATAVGGSFTANAEDTDGNISADSTGVVGTPGTPPPGTGHRWNPGDYAKGSGDPMQTNQGEYEAAQKAVMNNQALDGPMVGTHVAVAWGAVNPVGTTMDYTFINEMLTIAQSTNRMLSLQIQYKNFSAAPKGLQAPSDLVGEIYDMNQGFIAGIWKESVMDRFITALGNICTDYADNPYLEMITISESVPSFGGVDTSGYDYSHPQFATQLRRLYLAMSTACDQVNFAANLNELGTEIPALVEYAYSVGIMMGGPDAREKTGYMNFQGDELSGGPPVRDYRGLMGGFWTISNSVMDPVKGWDPPEIINREQAHGTTHRPWITYGTGADSWANVLSALAADPTPPHACPQVYVDRDGCQ